MNLVEYDIFIEVTGIYRMYKNEACDDLFGVYGEYEYKNLLLERWRLNFYNIIGWLPMKEKTTTKDQISENNMNLIDTPEELIHLEVSLSFFKRNFWDLWLQKIFRNLASMKFQLLIMLYVPVIWGMFNFKPGTSEPWISATVGLGFLGGGYVTLAVSRFVSKTNLVEHSDIKFDTDK